MRNIILSAVALISSTAAFSQLYTRGNSFIYSDETDVFVKDEIDLGANTFFYLREEAQLIQDNDVDNLGAGILSVFQEGNTNNFTYNYWSSPVSNAGTGIDGNVGFQRTMLHYPTVPGFDGTNATIEDFNLTTTAEPADFLPESQFNGTSDDGTDATPLEIAARYMYTYNSQGDVQSGFAGWNALQSDGAIAQTGLGFIMKGVIGTDGISTNPNYREFIPSGSFNNNVRAGQRYDFRGRANNGTITVGVANDNVTLAGNPYPSALDLKQFLFQATVPSVQINPEILFYETISADSHNFVEQLSGYATYTPLGFETGVNDGFAENGVYTSATFTRIDNNGVVNTTAPGGSPGGDTTDGARRYAPIGQGFFLARTNTAIPASQTSLEKPATQNITAGQTINSGLGITGEQVSFTNDMRRLIKENGTSSVFYRGAGTNSSSLQFMTLNVVSDNQYARPLNLVFSDNTTPGYDFAWEASLNGRNDNDAYIMIDRSEYGLSSQPYTLGSRIPLGVAVDPALTAPISVEFEIAKMENFTPPNVYIFDAQTNLYHEITSTNHTMMVAPGHHVDRFFVTFVNRTLSNETIDAFADLNAYQNNAAMELNVFNPQAIDLKSIEIYDLAGRLVANSNPKEIQSNYTFNTASYAQGIYIVRMTNADDQQKSVKVSVSNR